MFFIGTTDQRKSRVTYKADGSQRIFLFPFDYIRKAFIKAMLDGASLEYPKDYLVNGKQLEFAEPPKSNTIIEIYRKTPSTRLVSFEDSSVLRSKDLNIFEVQLLHRTEETEDAVQESGMAIDPFDETWDGRYKRIKNVAAPVNAQDAVNLQYVEDAKTGISSDRIKAEQAALTATTQATQATIATTKAGEASQSASEALSHKNTAVSASGTATLAKNAAVNAQVASESARDQSVLAKESSQESAVESEDWAKKAKEAAGIASGIPTGTIIAWGGLTAPAGYLECAGQVLKRDIYKDLFQAIGTVWGTTAGDDFKLPDFKSAARFLRSRGDGLEVGMMQEDAIRNIKGSLPHLASITTAADLTGVFRTGALDTPVTSTRYLNSSVGTYPSTVMDISLQVPTADENRPKNAVVMYCIKAVDEYINPSQVDIEPIIQQLVNKPNREEIKELAGTRPWVSGEYLPIANTPTIVSHGLSGIDPLKCRCDVLLICKVAEHGYSVNDTAIAWYGVMHNGSGYLCTTTVPLLTKNQIQYNTISNQLFAAAKTSGAQVGLTHANWRYVFRIWH